MISKSQAAFHTQTQHTRVLQCRTCWGHDHVFDIAMTDPKLHHLLMEQLFTMSAGCDTCELKYHTSPMPLFVFFSSLACKQRMPLSSRWARRQSFSISARLTQGSYSLLYVICGKHLANTMIGSQVVCAPRYKIQRETPTKAGGRLLRSQRHWFETSIDDCDVFKKCWSKGHVTRVLEINNDAADSADQTWQDHYAVVDSSYSTLVILGVCWPLLHQVVASAHISSNIHSGTRIWKQTRWEYMRMLYLEHNTPVQPSLIGDWCII